MKSEEWPCPQTRVEIAEALAGAFVEGAATREHLLAAAKLAGTRRVVVRTLERLPDRPFHELRDLWTYLGDVPIEPGRRPTSDSVRS